MYDTPLDQRERLRLTLAIVRGIEDDRNPAGRRIEPQLPDELVAVHHRHEHVGNHQIGMLRPYRGQALAAVRRLDQPMSLVRRIVTRNFRLAERSSAIRMVANQGLL